MRRIRITKRRPLAIAVGLAVAAILVAPSSALAAAPSNDDVTNPKVVEELPYSDTIDVTDASTDPGDPTNCNAGKSVWYSYTPEETKRIAADTAGSDYSAYLGVFRDAPSNNTLIACSNYRDSSRVSFNAKAGETYWFMASGDGGVLVFNMAVVIPPKNDEIGSAKKVTVELPYKDVLDTREASLNINDPECSGRSRSVWYRYERPRRFEDKRIEINTFRSNYNTTLSVYTGPRNQLQQLECNDNASGSYTSKVRFVAEAGKTYYIMVGSSRNSKGGRLVLTVKEPPRPFGLRATVSPTGSVSEITGSARVSGTVRCTRETQVYISVTLRQKVDERVVTASDSKRMECKGQDNWQVTLSSDRPFKKGEAGVWFEVSAPREDRERQKTRVVTLKPCSGCL